MPELPEVESIRNKLIAGSTETPTIIGMEISGALLLWKRSLSTPDKVSFLVHIQGQAIEALKRRGKYFVFRLSENFLLVHLRMSGDLMLEKQSTPLDKYCRLALFLNDDWRLSFNDTRKFGRVWLVEDPLDVVGDLGPEPLDMGFTSDNLYDALRGRRRRLKPLLMDQRFIAGLGNIYTDEALHLAKLSPLTISNQLTSDQAEILLESIRTVLREGIDHNGSSIDWMYRGGGHQEYFRVYDRKGESCQTCGAEIVRVVVGQRGTYYCPICQSVPT